jgi:hypothetical protein
MTESAAEPVFAVRLPWNMWSALDSSLDEACRPIGDGPDEAPLSPDDLESIRTSTVVEVEEQQNGRLALVITALPVQINPNRTLIEIADQVRDGHLTGIADLGDYSASSVTRLVMVLKREVDPGAIRDRLLGVIAEHYLATRTLALAVRHAARAQVRSDDQPRTASDGIVTVSLTRTQWEFIQSEIARHLPEPTWDQPSATNLGWQAMWTIDEQV